MKCLNLYSTEACHLCEVAKELIWSVISGTDFQLNEIDIAENEQLLAEYSLIIPVLENTENNKKIVWPFGSEDVSQLLLS